MFCSAAAGLDLMGTLVRQEADLASDLVLGFGFFFNTIAPFVSLIFFFFDSPTQSYDNFH